jgi:chromosomal replication initiation ATPase DnaA
MKIELFNMYTTEVCKVFDVEENEIFVKSKEATFVDARYLLYYLCSARKIKITYIQKYMRERGYDIPHSTIHYGINQVKEKVHEDQDYQVVIDKINRLCMV